MRLSVRYSGRVQGVGFRATVHSFALNLPVSGWVRNEPDGAVRLEVQGDETSVRHLLDLIRHRAPGFIQHVDERMLSDLPSESGFVIAR